MKIVIEDNNVTIDGVDAEPLFPAGGWRAGETVVTVQVTTSKKWVKGTLKQQFRRNTGGRPPSLEAAELAHRVDEAMRRGQPHMDAIRLIASNAGLSIQAVRLKIRRFNARRHS